MTKTPARKCAYAKYWGQSCAFGTYPKCSATVTHVSRDYWTGEARKKFGPDMFLCQAHFEFGCGGYPRPEKLT